MIAPAVTATPTGSHTSTAGPTFSATPTDSDTATATPTDSHTSTVTPTDRKSAADGQSARARAALAARKRRYKARRHSSFLPTATWRAEVKMLVTHPLFNDVVLFVIVLNSYVVCWADPRGPDPLWLQYTQIIR